MQTDMTGHFTLLSHLCSLLFSSLLSSLPSSSLLLPLLLFPLAPLLSLSPCLSLTPPFLPPFFFLFFLTLSPSLPSSSLVFLLSFLSRVMSQCPSTLKILKTKLYSFLAEVCLSLPIIFSVQIPILQGIPCNKILDGITGGLTHTL